MKPDKITIDFATYEQVFSELAKWQRHLQKNANSTVCKSERAKARATEHAEMVQGLLDDLVDAELNED